MYLTSNCTVYFQSETDVSIPILDWLVDDKNNWHSIFNNFSLHLNNPLHWIIFLSCQRSTVIFIVRLLTGQKKENWFVCGLPIGDGQSAPTTDWSIIRKNPVALSKGHKPDKVKKTVSWLAEKRKSSHKKRLFMNLLCL